jgi:hypothetical protein
MSQAQEHDVQTRVDVVELDVLDARSTFDTLTKAQLGMSGAEFLAAYDAGEFDNATEADHPGLTNVVMALPFAR